MATNADYLRRQRDVLVPTYDPAPIALQGGQGSRVWDVEGNEYLDFAAGVAATSLGHAHPALVAAVTGQVRRLVHASNLFVLPAQIELAERLTTISGLDRAFFCNSGTEAMEACIKIARAWGQGHGGRTRIVAATGGFHGRTLGSLSITGQPHYQQGFGPLLQDVEFVPFGDAATLEAAVGPGTAAVVLEPIQGEGGVRIPPPEYLKRAREACDRHGALLILDEVQTGIGRTGTWFAYQQEGIVPDVVALAKGLGGGVPIGAVVVNERANVLGPGMHGSTFGGNPLAATAALAVLGAIERERLLENVQARGRELTLGLAELVADGRAVATRGRGLLHALDVEAGQAKATSRTLATDGLLTSTCGPSTLRFSPPLTVGQDDIQHAIKILQRSMPHPAGIVASERV